ncbi:MAG: twin-arginine translocation signal domain-containing protein [Streptococcus sp.]
MTDEKFLDKKMDRREFLKKAGIGGAGLALGLSGASAFFTNQDSSSKKAYDGDEDISFFGSTRLGLRLLCRRLAAWWC